MLSPGGMKTKETSGRIHATATRPTNQNDKHIEHACEQGKAQAIIARMDPVVQSWGKYCYVNEYTKQDHQRVRQSIYEQWHRKYAGDFCGSFDKTFRVLALVNMAVEDMKQRMTTGKQIPVAQIWALMDIHKSNARRDGWHEKLDEMQRIIDDLDRDALMPLGVLCGFPPC